MFEFSLTWRQLQYQLMLIWEMDSAPPSGDSPVEHWYQSHRRLQKHHRQKQRHPASLLHLDQSHPVT